MQYQIIKREVLLSTDGPEEQRLKSFFFLLLPVGRRKTFKLGFPQRTVVLTGLPTLTLPASHVTSCL